MKKIEILGTGCAKCEKLAVRVSEAATELKLDCDIEKVTDIQKITAYGVMMTPALVIDGSVVTVGSVPSVDEIKRLIG